MPPTRRTVLAGAVASAAILALDACTPAKRTPEPTSASPSTRATAPAGRTEKGFNLSPRSQDYRYSSPWTGLWLDWDWEGTIKRDLDLGIELGGTIVRAVGAPQGVLRGELDQQLYFDRMLQVLEYCAAKKVRFYPAGGTLRGWQQSDLPSAQLQALYVAQAELLERHHATVFGFDINNELVNAYRSFDPVGLRATVAGWARGIRQAAPSIPLTVSNVIRNPDWGYLTFPELESELDFFDFHLANAMPDDAVAAWRAHKPVVIGEVDVRRTAADRATRYASIVDAAVTGGAEAILAWDITSNDYGLYDAGGQNLDAGLAAGFARIPGR